MEKRQIGALVLAGAGVAFAAVNFDEFDVKSLLGTRETQLIVVIAVSILVGTGVGMLVSRRRG